MCLGAIFRERRSLLLDSPHCRSWLTLWIHNNRYGGLATIIHGFSIAQRVGAPTPLLTSINCTYKQLEKNLVAIIWDIRWLD